jgi:hypothetical protein
LQVSDLPHKLILQPICGQKPAALLRDEESVRHAPHRVLPFEQVGHSHEPQRRLVPRSPSQGLFDAHGSPKRRVMLLLVMHAKHLLTNAKARRALASNGEPGEPEKTRWM